MPLIHCDSMPEANWLNEDEAQYKLSNAVHVWQLQLSTHARYDYMLHELLTSDERARAGSYHQEKDRTRFVVSRGVLRILLGQYMGMDARTIAFGMSDSKKPFATGNAPLQYNMAHAGDWALIAISDKPVGVDTEPVNTTLDVTDIIGTCMSAGDEQSFASVSRRNFCQCWTRKEALLKATGKGMDDDLPLVPCLDGNHEVAANIIGSELDWNVMSFDVDDDNVGCVAYDPSLGAPVFYRVQHIADYL